MSGDKEGKIITLLNAFISNIKTENGEKLDIDTDCKMKLISDIEDIILDVGIKGYVGVIANNYGNIVAEASHFGTQKQGFHNLESAQKQFCLNKLKRVFLEKHVNDVLSKNASLDFCNDFWDNAEARGYTLLIKPIGYSPTD